MLEPRAEPEDPDHGDVNEWLGDYSRNELHRYAINALRGRIAARGNAAAKADIGP